MPYEYSFEKLDAWKKAKELVVLTYKITAGYPPEERFGLTLQMRKAAVSTASNLSEGSGRTTSADKARLSEIAFGSLLELLNQYILSKELGYITEQALSEIRPLVDDTAIRINNLRKSQLKGGR